MTNACFGSRWMPAAVAAVSLLLGGTSTALAQDGDWYIGASIPLMFIDDSDATSTGSTTFGGQSFDHNVTVKSEHDTGYKLGAMLGYRLDSGLRIEGEIFMARADISKLTNTDITVAGNRLPIEVPLDVSGAAKQLGVMANLWYDLETIDDAWTPYIGGGVGLVRVDQGDLRYDANALAEAIAGPPLQRFPGGALPEGYVPTPSATDTAFAYQVGAGVGYALSESATLQFGYRMQVVNGLEFSGMNANGTVRAETDLRIHFLEIGIRQRF